MLTLTVPMKEYFNDATSEFVTVPGRTLRLEHSLVSVSKWESKWEKPFLSREPMSRAESLDYIRCMTLDEDVDPRVYWALDADMVKQIERYIEAPMTATKIEETHPGSGGSVLTAEVIYYYMVALHIPFSCESWHLNRLLTLIRVCNEKNRPAKPMTQREIMQQNRKLNEKRRRALRSRG